MATRKKSGKGKPTTKRSKTPDLKVRDADTKKVKGGLLPAELQGEYAHVQQQRHGHRLEPIGRAAAPGAAAQLSDSR